MQTVNKLVIGSVRSIDSRGRIHIPPEILSSWGKEVREVNIFVENDIVTGKQIGRAHV